MALGIGDSLPEVLGKDQNGNTLYASNYAGKKLVLYFYPKDNTSGCTAEACSFRDKYAQLKELGYEVLGVSVDSALSHQKFIEKQQLPFDLLADTEKSLVEQFGVWGEKSMYGRKYMGTTRTTFLVNEEGVIIDIMQGKEIKTAIHAQQIIDKNL